MQVKPLVNTPMITKQLHSIPRKYHVRSDARAGGAHGNETKVALRSYGSMQDVSRSIVPLTDKGRDAQMAVVMHSIFKKFATTKLRDTDRRSIGNFGHISDEGERGTRLMKASTLSISQPISHASTLPLPIPAGLTNVVQARNKSTHILTSKQRCIPPGFVSPGGKPFKGRSLTRPKQGATQVL
jgi:hypothetical protein